MDHSINLRRCELDLAVTCREVAHDLSIAPVTAPFSVARSCTSVWSRDGDAARHARPGSHRSARCPSRAATTPSLQLVAGVARQDPDCVRKGGLGQLSQRFQPLAAKNTSHGKPANKNETLVFVLLSCTYSQEFKVPLSPEYLAVHRRLRLQREVLHFASRGNILQIR